MHGNRHHLIIGIILIVLGVLLVLGRLGIAGLLPFAGIVLIVLGILILLRILAGGTLVGILSLVVGILLQGHFLSLPNAIGQFLWLVDLVLGIILIITGIQRIRG